MPLAGRRNGESLGLAQGLERLLDSFEFGREWRLFFAQIQVDVESAIDVTCQAGTKEWILCASPNSKPSSAMRND